MKIRILNCLVMDMCVCGKTIHTPQGGGYISEERDGNEVAYSQALGYRFAISKFKNSI